MFSLEARYTARAVVFGALTALLVAYALAGAACAPTTRVVAAWKDPLVGDVVVQRPLVVFQHPSEALRRSVEDALVQRIPGAVPAYRLIGTDQIFDVLGIQQQVQQAGFDTVMITRLVDVKENIDQLPGPPGQPRPNYDPLWGAWNAGWVQVAEPGYLDTSTVVTLESLVYAIDRAPAPGPLPGPSESEGQLVWAGRSETFDPRSFQSLAKSVAGAAVAAMSKDGVVVTGVDER